MFYVYFFFACAIEARKSGSLKARMRDSDAIGGSTRRNHEKKFTRNTKRKRSSRHGVGTGTLNSVGTLRSGTLGTLGRKSTNRPPPGVHLGKSPPRPSPASVAYHSDEESLKCYDENPDDSSVTEKPSEVSSSEASQVS